jgi:hypothetical protein
MEAFLRLLKSRFVFAALFLPGVAFASCPATPTDCGSPTMNNIRVGSTANIGMGTANVTPNWGFQTQFDVDPSALSTNARQNNFSTILNYGANTTNIWENVNSFLFVNGPGIAQGEINQFHAYNQVNAGARENAQENFESSYLNNGIMGNIAGYLALFHNGAAGTVLNGATAMTMIFQNDNPAAGSVNQWAGIAFQPRIGVGSKPTFYDAIVIKDPDAGIVTLGGINVGSIANAAPGQLQILGPDNSGATVPFIFKNTIAGIATPVMFFTDAGIVNFVAAGVTVNPTGIRLSVGGPDNSGATFPFAVKNLALDRVFDVTDAGVVTLSSGVFITQPAGVLVSFLSPDNSGSTFPLSVKNLAASRLFDISAAGQIVFNDSKVVFSPSGVIVNITGPDTSGATTVFTLKNSATTNLFSVDDAGVIRVGTSAGVTCAPGLPTASFQTVSGVVVHC